MPLSYGLVSAASRTQVDEIGQEPHPGGPARRAADYLSARRKAARGIERQLQAELGAEVFSSLYRLLEALGGDQRPRMSDYLRERSNLDRLAYPGD